MPLKLPSLTQIGSYLSLVLNRYPYPSVALLKYSRADKIVEIQNIVRCSNNGKYHAYWVAREGKLVRGYHGNNRTIPVFPDYNYFSAEGKTEEDFRAQIDKLNTIARQLSMKNTGKKNSRSEL